MECENRERLLLQFHITGNCNLRCKHCYRTEGDAEPLSYEDVVRVVEQFKALRRRYNRAHQTARRGHINLTGGEPFIHREIDRILDYLGDQRRELTFGVLSNGSFLTEERIARLKKNQVAFVQLSIDGDPATHNALRAAGDYERVFATAERLERAGIRTQISFTANRENFRFLPLVAKECRRRGISKLWSDRLVPIGNGAALDGLVIDRETLPQYLKAMKKAQGGWLAHLRYPKTQVTMNRALQFQGARGSIYSCSAGEHLITVDEFGNIMPCRRLPILCGTVFETTLEAVYCTDPTFAALREKQIPAACEQCKMKLLCRGGARCQSAATYGRVNRADPACPWQKTIHYFDTPGD